MASDDKPIIILIVLLLYVICVGTFLEGLPSRFKKINGFQHFVYDVSRYGLLRAYLTWSSLTDFVESINIYLLPNL